MGKLKDSKGNVVLNLDYSMNEQFTGNYWIDSKKIYCKVFKKSNIALSNGVNVAHGISDIDQIIDYDVATWHSDTGTLVKYYSGANGSANGLSARIDKTNIQFAGNDTWSASNTRTLYVIILYTKITD